MMKLYMNFILIMLALKLRMSIEWPKQDLTDWLYPFRLDPLPPKQSFSDNFLEKVQRHLQITTVALNTPVDTFYIKRNI